MRMTRTFLALTLVAGIASAADYTIDDVHSTVLFKVKHMGASYSYGEFVKSTGTFSFDAKDVTRNALDITVEAGSAVTFDKERDTHLKSPDFLNAKEFPQITFKSTSWKKSEDGAYEVTGDLTLLGQTKEITVTAHHVGTGKNLRNGQELVGLHSEFEIDRGEFGMKYGIVPNDSALGRIVTLIVSLEGAANS